MEEKGDETVERILQTDQNDESLKTLIEKIQKQDLTPTGRVLGIIKRMPRNFCGHLKPTEEMRDKTKEFEIREFIPADSRYPYFLLKIRNVRSNKR